MADPPQKRRKKNEVKEKEKETWKAFSLSSLFELPESEEGLLRKFGFLFDKGIVDVDSIQPKGWWIGLSPLMIAVQKKNLLLTKFLVEHKANVNLPLKQIENASEEEHWNWQRDWIGATPLIIAVKNNCIPIAELLIKHGADVNASREDGAIPLSIATFANSVPMIELLVDNGANMDLALREQLTPLMIACQEGFLEVVQVLLKKGASPNALDQEGTSPLEYAADGNSVEILKILLDAGANPNSISQVDVFPLYLAAQQGKLEFVKLLVEGGANVHLQLVQDGDTALGNACSNGFVDIVRYLIEKGSDVAHKSLRGDTPLHYAVSSNEDETNRCEIARLLLSQGADPNIRNQENVIPLHLTVEMGLREITNLLLGSQASTSIINNETPVDVARRIGDLELSQLLENYCGELKPAKREERTNETLKMNQ